MWEDSCTRKVGYKTCHHRRAIRQQGGKGKHATRTRANLGDGWNDKTHNQYGNKEAQKLTEQVVESEQQTRLGQKATRHNAYHNGYHNTRQKTKFHLNFLF